MGEGHSLRRSSFECGLARCYGRQAVFDGWIPQRWSAYHNKSSMSCSDYWIRLSLMSVKQLRSSKLQILTVILMANFFDPQSTLSSSFCPPSRSSISHLSRCSRMALPPRKVSIQTLIQTHRSCRCLQNHRYTRREASHRKPPYYDAGTRICKLRAR